MANLHQLEYRLERPSWLRKHRRIVIAIAAVVFAISFLRTMARARFSYNSICPLCGKVQYTDDWNIPFTEINLWSTHSESETPLSAALRAANELQTHAHNWYFSWGSGNGAFCALGGGHQLSGLACQPHFATYIETVLRFEQPRVRGILLQRLRDPCEKNCDTLRFAAGFSGLPEAGFADVKSFERWRAAHKQSWDESTTAMETGSP